MSTTPTEIRVRLAVWTARVRAVRAAEQSYRAAANAYSEMPTPVSDPWHGDYRRALAAAETTKADAAAQYAEQGEAVISQLLDIQAASEMALEQVPA